MTTIRNSLPSRRDVIGTIALVAGATGVSGLRAIGQEKTEAKEDTGVTPAEDLMREHAGLSRLLLIYEKLIPTVSTTAPWPAAELSTAARLIQTFVEDYHEKLEEDHLFPRFQKAGKLVDLVTVLLAQHGAGRRLIADILRLAEQPKNMSDPAQLTDCMKQFIRMYRPHAAREATVLFPQIASIVGAKEYHQLGDRFEEIEHEKFGPSGFEGIVTHVEDLEKKLGIYDLGQFTPKSA